MAKGLFAVYRDDAPNQTPAAASSASRGPAINKLAARRPGGASGQDLPRRGLGLREKENVDPFASTMPGKGAPAKGKVPGKVPKLGGGSSQCRQTLSTSSLVAAAPDVTLQHLRRGVDAPTNGICTGTLRTRVLPDLPPLPLPAEAAAAAVAKHAHEYEAPAATVAIPKPCVVEVRLAPGSTESSPQSSCDRSYASATDSGYAQSPTAPTRRSNSIPRHPDFREKIGDVVADETDSDMSLVEEADGSVGDADRCARALTESPLAEITQAFTGLGGFSVANMSPTPATAGHSAARFRVPNSTQRRPSSLLRPPDSPTRKTPTLGIAGIRPGGGAPVVTGTTKRLKPGQTVPSAPKAAPGRSMRL